MSLLSTVLYQRTGHPETSKPAEKKWLDGVEDGKTLGQHGLRELRPEQILRR